MKNRSKLLKLTNEKTANYSSKQNSGSVPSEDCSLGKNAIVNNKRTYDLMDEYLNKPKSKRKKIRHMK